MKKKLSHEKIKSFLYTKKKVLKIFLIFIFPLIEFFNFISTKNIAIIGDSRIVDIGVNLFGFSLNNISPSYGRGTNIISTNFKTYGHYNCKIIAENGASYSTFENRAERVHKGVIKVLSKSTSGTNVFLCLGVNNLDSKSTFNYYKSLAIKYKKLKFFVISVTGVASKSKISNDKIKKFNSKMKSLIKKTRLSNLKFKSILLNNDPTKVAINNNVVLTIDDSTTDIWGLHYKKRGYKAIFKSMVYDL